MHRRTRASSGGSITIARLSHAAETAIPHPPFIRWTGRLRIYYEFLLLLCMIVWEGRMRGLWRWMLVQLVHHHGDGLLELRVVARAPGSRVHLHLDVGIHTVVLHVPSAVRIPEGEVRRRNGPAIHKDGVSADPHQAAPRAPADELADLSLAEHPRHQVAAGAGIFIDDHRLRAKYG